MNTDSNDSVSTDPFVSEPKKPGQISNGKKPDSPGGDGSKKYGEGEGKALGMIMISDGQKSWISMLIPHCQKVISRRDVRGLGQDSHRFRGHEQKLFHRKI